MTATTEENKTVARGAFWSLSGAISLKVIGLIYTILLARLFAPSEVGIFYLGLGIVYILGTISNLGLNSSLKRYVPFFIGRGELKKAGELFSATYFSSGALAIFFALLLFFLANPISEIFMQPELAPVLMVLSLYLLIDTVFGVNLAILLALLRIKEMQFLENLLGVLKIPVTLLLFWMFGADAIIIAASLALCYPIVLGISFFCVKKATQKEGLTFFWGNWRRKALLLAEALPLGIAIVLVAELNSLSLYMDRLMLGLLLPPEFSPEYIGIYSMAVSMALVIAIFPAAVAKIFSPLIAKFYGMGKFEEMKKIARTSARWSVILLAPVAILMASFSEEIMQLFYGAAYASGGIVLTILAIGLFFRHLASIQGSILAAMRIVRAEILAAGTGLVINILLNLLLIPEYGMVGAAIAAGLALLTSSFILLFYCKKIVGSAFVGEQIVPVSVAILLFVLIFAIRGPVWELTGGLLDRFIIQDDLMVSIVVKMLNGAVLGVLLALIAGTYFTLLVLVKGIKGEDWEILLASMRKARVPEPIISGVDKLSRRFC